MDLNMTIRMDPGEDGEIFEVGSEPLCLEFVNTVSARKGRFPYEWLPNYANLAAWGHQAGLLNADQVMKLLRQAQNDPPAAQNVWRRALDLRDAIYRLVSAHAAGQPVQMEDLAALNSEIPAAYQHLQLTPEKDGLAWRWPDAPDALDGFLWPVVRSAAELLTSPDLERAGECHNPTCGWLYLDTSKNHSRRWCDMSSCGNTAKAHSFYQRKRQQKASLGQLRTLL
jgi:predicted RNA-binding Zn ribbon-like protein